MGKWIGVGGHAEGCETPEECLLREAKEESEFGAMQGAHGGVWECPDLVEIPVEGTFKDSKTTIIYDTNDQELCTMKNTKDMYYVSYQEIPVTLVNSFVVMEDRQFYKHSGYDIKAILRAIVINQKSNDIAQGASTITQQHTLQQETEG